MKEKREKLELKKRTIANLSNMEMSFVYGGNGDDEGDGPSRKHCNTVGEDDDVNKILSEAAKIALSKLIIVC